MVTLAPCCVVAVLFQTEKTTGLKALLLSFVSYFIVFLDRHNTTLAPHHVLDNGGWQSEEVARIEAKEIQD